MLCKSKCGSQNLFLSLHWRHIYDIKKKGKSKLVCLDCPFGIRYHETNANTVSERAMVCDQVPNCGCMNI